MERGDHLISPRTGYSHHGLYLGKNQVIHYTGFSDGRHKGVIGITTLEEFCQGEGFSIQRYGFRLYNHDESAQRALSRLGEDWYDILLNNCEHYVTWCILGIHHSHQVSRLISAAEFSRKLLTAPAIESVTTETTRHLARHAMNSTASSEAHHAVGTVAGVMTGGSVAAGSAVTTGLVTGITALSASPVVVTVGLGAAVGYGVKKLLDWALE